MITAVETVAIVLGCIAIFVLGVFVGWEAKTWAP